MIVKVIELVDDDEQETMYTGVQSIILMDGRLRLATAEGMIDLPVDEHEGRAVAVNVVIA